MDGDFAVVKLGGSQYLVQKGDVVQCEKMSDDEGKKVKAKDVYLLKKGKKLDIGKPTVNGAEVEFEVVEHGRGKKLDIFKYKAKSRYRRRIGHRQQYTKLKVVKI